MYVRFYRAKSCSKSDPFIYVCTYLLNASVKIIALIKIFYSRNTR